MRLQAETRGPRDQGVRLLETVKEPELWTNLGRLGFPRRQDRVLCPDTGSCFPKEKSLNVTSF